MSDFSVSGRVVVITGGGGLLGKSFGACLNQLGARVVSFDLPGKECEVKENWISMPVDVTSRSSLKAGMQEVENRWGIPEALINAAAIDATPDAGSNWSCDFASFSEAAWNQMMETNVKGIMLSCQVIGQRMADAGRGSIVNISSIYGMVSPDQRIYGYHKQEPKGRPFFKPIAYSVSKSAIFNLTRYLATYWAGSKVRVNTVTFGGVFSGQDKRFVENYSEKVPLGRMAEVHEYHGAIIFLVSNASTYMTGANLVIDGGYTAW